MHVSSELYQFYEVVCVYVEYLEFSMYIVNCSLSFPSCMFFISFSCLVELSRTSGTVVSNTGESGHSLLFSNLTEKEFSFPPLSTMLSVEFCLFVFVILGRICS